MKRFLAVLTGCAVGIIVIFISEKLGHIIYPLPANIDPKNMEQLKELMATVPPMYLILVLIGAFLGSFVGGLISTIIVKTKDKTPALIVGLVLTVLGLINILFIPHPMWFNVSALLIYFVGASVGYTIYFKMKKNV
jgi:hypothetical protein